MGFWICRLLTQPNLKGIGVAWFMCFLNLLFEFR